MTGTIGYRIGVQIDGDRDRYMPAGDFHGECRAHGVKAKVTAQMLDAWAEAEIEKRTWNGWGRTVCPTCNLAMSDDGGCPCVEDGRSAQNRLLASLGLPLVAEPGEAPPGPRVLPVHGPLTWWETEVAEAKCFAAERGTTPAAAARARGNREVAAWLEAKEEADKEARAAEVKERYNARMRARGIL